MNRSVSPPSPSSSPSPSSPRSPRSAASSSASAASSSSAEPNRLLRVAKVSRCLDVSTRHVYRLIQQGDLEGVRVGVRQIRVTRESLDELLRLLRADYQAYDADLGDLRSRSPRWAGRRAAKSAAAAARPSRETPPSREVGAPRAPLAVRSADSLEDRSAAFRPSTKEVAR